MKLVYYAGAMLQKGEQVPLPKSWKRFSMPWAVPVYTRYPGFSLLEQELQLPRFGLFFLRTQTDREITLHLTNEKSTLALQCVMAGNIRFNLPEQLVGEHQYALFYIPAGNNGVVISPGIVESLQLEIEGSWLQDLSDQFPDIRVLAESPDRKTKEDMALSPLSLNYIAAAILRNIRQCVLSGGELRLEMEKYLLELLTEYIRQVREREDEKRLPFAAHKSALLGIKEEILLAPNVNEHTISALARSAALSETALKKNFRILFGEPVAVFVRRHALQKAKYLLETTTRSIDDIADEVGYSSFTNFATPFRKVFGCTPRQLRDSRPAKPPKET